MSFGLDLTSFAGIWAGNWTIWAGNDPTWAGNDPTGIVPWKGEPIENPGGVIIIGLATWVTATCAKPELDLTRLLCVEMIAGFIGLYVDDFLAGEEVLRFGTVTFDFLGFSA